MYIDSGKAHLRVDLPVPEPPVRKTGFLRKRLQSARKRFAAWRERRRIEHAFRHLDDRLREDVGYPRAHTAFTMIRTFR